MKSPLERLVGHHIAMDKFFEEFWDKTALAVPHTPSDLVGPFDSILCLSDMDHLLMRAKLANAEIILFEGLRKTETYATPHAAFSSGASIVINHVDKLWPRINELCSELGRTFRHAYANLYLTPHESQTAPPHSDDRDVLVLQLHGCKRWCVWARGTCESTPRPFADEQAGKDDGAPPLDPLALGAPELETTLEPGALLYIPRGALHMARATGADCSLHVTVAVPTADNCLSGYVLHAVGAQCFGERRFRQALPLGPWPGRGPRRLPGQMLAASRTGRNAASDTGAETASEATSATSEGAAAADGGMQEVALCVDPSAEASKPQSADEGALLASTPSAAVEGALGVWREQSRELWRAMHAAAGLPEARAELSARMQRHRQAQARMLAALEARLVHSIRHAPSTTLSLWPRTRLRKLVRFELIRPDPDRPDDGRRVAQAQPEPGGPGRLAYIHTASALLRPLQAVESWALRHTFELCELPARDAFLRACAARALLGLEVLIVVDGGQGRPGDVVTRSDDEC